MKYIIVFCGQPKSPSLIPLIVNQLKELKANVGELMILFSFFGKPHLLCDALQEASINHETISIDYTSIHHHACDSSSIQLAQIRSAVKYLRVHGSVTPDTLIFKTRPDLLIHTSDLINLFPDLAEQLATTPWKRWVPWFDLYNPYWIADECFIARFDYLEHLYNQSSDSFPLLLFPNYSTHVHILNADSSHRIAPYHDYPYLFHSALGQDIFASYLWMFSRNHPDQFNTLLGPRWTQMTILNYYRYISAYYIITPVRKTFKAISDCFNNPSGFSFNSQYLESPSDRQARTTICHHQDYIQEFLSSNSPIARSIGEHPLNSAVNCPSPPRLEHVSSYNISLLLYMRIIMYGPYLTIAEPDTLVNLIAEHHYTENDQHAVEFNLIKMCASNTEFMRNTLLRYRSHQYIREFRPSTYITKFATNVLNVTNPCLSNDSTCYAPPSLDILRYQQFRALRGYFLRTSQN